MISLQVMHFINAIKVDTPLQSEYIIEILAEKDTS